MTWTNRILRTAEADPRTLLAHPDNWRLHPDHQQQVMSGVLSDLGWIQHVVVSERTGRIVDGHLRVLLARAHEQATVPAVYVDLSPEEEAKALASFDAVAALAETDAAALLRALDEVSSPSGDLEQFFADLARDAATVVETTSGHDPAARHSAPARLARHPETIKTVISVTQLATIERALRLTGIPRRGEALALICQRYLDTLNGHAERQHDPEAENRAAAQLARATAHTDLSA